MDYAKEDYGVSHTLHSLVHCNRTSILFFSFFSIIYFTFFQFFHSVFVMLVQWDVYSVLVGTCILSCHYFT